MKINILTLFPDMFDSFLKTSLIARGLSKNIFDIKLFNIRDVATDAHKSVDARPYGGGAGMLLRVDIIDRALKEVLKSGETKRANDKSNRKIILLSPQGNKFDSKKARELAQYDNLVFICGHYEGFDERIIDLVDEELSIGDFVTTGGELPAMLIIDAVARFIPNFLGKEQSPHIESFELNHNARLLEFPQYTRPEEYNGQKVPEILLSGHHKNVEAWRLKEATEKTKRRRPDLLEKLTD